MWVRPMPRHRQLAAGHFSAVVFQRRCLACFRAASCKWETNVEVDYIEGFRDYRRGRTGAALWAVATIEGRGDIKLCHGVCSSVALRTVTMLFDCSTCTFEGQNQAQIQVLFGLLQPEK